MGEDFGCLHHYPGTWYSLPCRITSPPPGRTVLFSTGSGGPSWWQLETLIFCLASMCVCLVWRECTCVSMCSVVYRCMCLCVYICSMHICSVCVHVRMCARAHVCTRACVCAYICVHLCVAVLLSELCIHMQDLYNLMKALQNVTDFKNMIVQLEHLSTSESCLFHYSNQIAFTIHNCKGCSFIKCHLYGQEFCVIYWRCIDV